MVYNSTVTDLVAVGKFQTCHGDVDWTANSLSRRLDLKCSIPNKHHRRSVRLQGYDYSELGAYFVTVCARDRKSVFGFIVDGEMRLNRFGEIVRETWEGLPEHYLSIKLGSFIIMPNHIHAVIIITGAGLSPAPTPAHTPLPEIVQALKSFSTRRCNEISGRSGKSIWQRNYYEHIIRSEDELNQISEYVEANPAQWAEDEENPVKAAGHA